MTTRALHFDRHHRHTTTINGETVSDYGAYLHAQEADADDGVKSGKSEARRVADREGRRSQGGRTDWYAILRAETSDLSRSLGRTLRCVDSVTLDRTTGSKGRAIMRGRSLAKAADKRAKRTPVTFTGDGEHLASVLRKAGLYESQQDRLERQRQEGTDLMARTRRSAVDTISPLSPILGSWATPEAQHTYVHHDPIHGPITYEMKGYRGRRGDRELLDLANAVEAMLA